MRILLLPVLLMTPCAHAAAPDYTRDACPVIGNAKSRIYHTPASDDYRRLLKGNRSGEDHRVCFQSEQDAKDAGYRKSRR